MPVKGQYSYTKEQFIKSYHESTTAIELLQKLKLSPTGGSSNSMLRSRCKEFGLPYKFNICKHYNVTDEDFIKYVKESYSIAETLTKMGLAPKGGNYSTFRNRVNRLNLDTSHFTGQAWGKDKTYGPKRPIEQYLSNEFRIRSSKLKSRLIKENIFEHKCYKCNLTKWNNQDIPLELEHIDGNNQNNNLENLTLLCPNCHAQTDTYRGKNIGNYATPA